MPITACVKGLNRGRSKECEVGHFHASCCTCGAVFPGTPRTLDTLMDDLRLAGWLLWHVSSWCRECRPARESLQLPKKRTG